jgi:uncharacterized membrane protein YfcA
MDILYFLLALSGFAIGFVGGMVGLVLGVVRFPLVMNIESSIGVTAGTNLGVSTLGAITATMRHYRQKNIQFRPFILLGTTGAIGAFIGSFLTSYVPITLLLIAIGMIVSYESFIMLKSLQLKKKNDSLANEFRVNRTDTHNTNLTHGKNELILLELLIGFGVGFLGGVVGLILGSIRMPAMITILKMESRVAVGTNLAAASVMGIAGLVGHIMNNNIDYLVLAVMGSGAMLGGYLGARYTNRFSERDLKRLIAIVLIIVAITMFLRAFQVNPAL